MKVVYTIAFLLFSISGYSQQVTNVVFVGPDGVVVEDAKKATSFILISQYPDGHFERYDYKMSAPLIKRRAYKDADLKILDGIYCEYQPSGYILYKGQYSNNEKDGDWYTYNNIGKVVLTTKYKNGLVISEDTTTATSLASFTKVEAEAKAVGGDKTWIKYLSDALEKADVTNKSLKGGNVLVNFMVDTTGKLTNIFLVQSAEYMLDDAATKIIANSPPWTPAVKDGFNIRAWRIQPFSFNVVEVE